MNAKSSTFEKVKQYLTSAKKAEIIEDEDPEEAAYLIGKLEKTTENCKDLLQLVGVEDLFGDLDDFEVIEKISKALENC